MTSPADTTEDHFLQHAPYRDASRPVVERIADLLGRMTAAEKAAQLVSPFGAMVDTRTPPDTRLGNRHRRLVLNAHAAARDSPSRQRAATCPRREDTIGHPRPLRGRALVGFKVRDATMFPEAIAQASTWNPDLVERMSATIGAQMVSVGARQALSPLADVAQDPRWGRVSETYGEDPYLVGQIASAFVRGIQGAVPDRPVIATLKHFVGYCASDGGRNTETANIGERELREVYGRPFEVAVREGGARAVMPSYNDLDGSPVSGSHDLLTGLLRDEYDFTGLVISDLEAVPQLHTKHGTAENVVAAYAQAFTAGMDVDLANSNSADKILRALEEGLLHDATLDRAVTKVLSAKFELGLFENPYVDVEAVPQTLDSEEARELAMTVASESIVLLQNQAVNGTPLLPLPADLSSIAVIGPNADRPLGQLGHYSYHVLDSMTVQFAAANDPQSRAADTEGLAGAGPDDAKLLVESVPIVTFLDGIRSRAGADVDVLYASGSRIASHDRSGFDDAVRAARAAEVAIVVVGDQSGINSLGTVGEGLDSSDLALPGVQRELVEAVVATGTPTVVVLSHGRPFAVDWMAESVPAIVTTWFGGEEAGNATAAMLFGDSNPAGRLPIAMLGSSGAAPVTYGRSLQGPAYVDGSIRALFPFGHGLSYTAFDYSGLTLDSPTVPTDGTIRLAFTVRNTGQRAGEEVIQVYGHDVHARTVRPPRVLLAFDRVPLAAGEARRLSVHIPTAMLALWDKREGWLIEPGRVELFIGGSSADIRLTAETLLIGDSHNVEPSERTRPSRVTSDR